MSICVPWLYPVFVELIFSPLKQSIAGKYFGNEEILVGNVLEKIPYCLYKALSQLSAFCFVDATRKYHTCFRRTSLSGPRFLTSAHKVLIAVYIGALDC